MVQPERAEQGRRSSLIRGIAGTNVDRADMVEKNLLSVVFLQVVRLPGFYPAGVKAYLQSALPHAQATVLLPAGELVTTEYWHAQLATCPVLDDAKRLRSQWLAPIAVSLLHWWTGPGGSGPAMLRSENIRLEKAPVNVVTPRLFSWPGCSLQPLPALR